MFCDIKLKYLSHMTKLPLQKVKRFLLLSCWRKQARKSSIYFHRLWESEIKPFIQMLIYTYIYIHIWFLWHFHTRIFVSIEVLLSTCRQSWLPRSQANSLTNFVRNYFPKWLALKLSNLQKKKKIVIKRVFSLRVGTWYKDFWTFLVWPLS